MVQLKNILLEHWRVEMPKVITCVYQDCFMCGAKGKKIQKIIANSKVDLTIRKVSFASPEGKELCAEAVFNRGIGTMPFFTDGKKFSTSLVDFAEKCEEKTEKIRKNVKKSTHNSVKSTPTKTKRVHKKKGGKDESN